MPHSWLVVLVASILLGMPVLVVSSGSTTATSGPSATLNYTIDPTPYNNIIHVVPWGLMDYPRVYVARNPSGPRNGTIYVVGMPLTTPYNLTQDIVVSTSVDGGATFSPPVETRLNLSSVFPNVVGLSTVRDLAVSSNGTLVVSTGSAGLLESRDGGLNWSYHLVWNSSMFVVALSSNPTTGRLYAVLGSNPASPLLLTSSLDGLHWDQPIPMPTRNVLPVFVQVAVRSETVVVAYASASDIYNYPPGDPPCTTRVLVSADGGASWNETANWSTGNASARPQVSMSSGGVVGVSWMDQQVQVRSPTRVLVVPRANVARSLDAGRSFSEPVALAVNTSTDYSNHGVPMVLDNTSRMYVAWSKYANANQTDEQVFAAISGNASGEFKNASFVTRVEQPNANQAYSVDLGLGLNETVYLVWFERHLTANGTTDPATSGVFFRSITGEAKGSVEDLTGAFQGGGPCVELRDAGGHTSAEVPWTGTELDIPQLLPQNYTVWLVSDAGRLFAGPMSVSIWGTTRFTISLTSGGSSPPGAWTWPAVAAGAAIALGASLTALHYTRLTRENVFQQKQRFLLYEYVRAHPGATQADIRRVFGLHNGVAAYHLDVLERQGFLHTEARRGHRWYYPSGDASLWRDVPLSPLQAAIVREVERRPGIGVRELSRSVDRKPSSVAENVKSLEHEGVLRTQRSGARLHCYSAQPPKTT